MAVNTEVLNMALRLKFEVDIDTDGNPVYKTRTYNNIKADATDQEIYDTGQVISSLQKNPLESIVKVVEMEIIEEI